MSTVESQATAVYKSVPGRQLQAKYSCKLSHRRQQSTNRCRGARSWAPRECGIGAGWCVLVNYTCHATAVIQLDHNSTNQPPECPDVVTNVDRAADNRSQGRRCAAPKPSDTVGAVCVCAVFSSVRVCSVQQHLHTSATRACAPRCAPPWPERPQRQVKLQVAFVATLKRC